MALTFGGGLVVGPVQPALAATGGTNVTSYGVSNGGADSTSSLQSLVNGGGKTLYFPAGTYRFAGVSLPANTTLNFDAGATILPGYNGGNFLNVNGAGVTINGGSFDGQNTIAIAVMGNSISGLTVDGVKATNMTNGNVNLVGCTNTVVKNTSSTNSQYGIVISGSSYVTVDGNYAYGMGRDGILAYSSTHHLTISNNYVERWALLSQDGRAAIHTYGSSDIVAFGNTVKNGTYNAEGIRFRDTERFEAYNNVIDNTGGSGIAVVSIGDWATVNGLVGGNGTIHDNTITNAHLRGISAPYVTDSNTHTYTLKPIRIFNNYIANTTRNAALFPYDSGDAIICYPKGSVVANNVIEGATGSGIRTDGGNTLVSDNTVTNTGTGDIGARSAVLAQANATVVRNTLTNVTYGYGLYGMAPVYQEGNAITGAAYGATNLSGGTAGKLAGDATAPSVWSDSTTTNYDAGNTLTVDATDANSGIAAIFVKMDTGAAKAYYGSPVTLGVGPVGTHVMSYWSVDMAGNKSTVMSRTFTVGGVVTPTPTPVPDPTPTPVPLAIAAPTNLAGAGVESGGYIVTSLSWTDAAANEAGFSVERAYMHDGTQDAWVSIDTLPADTTSYADRVSLGLNYKYRVRAYGSDGTTTIYSPYSNEVTVTAPGTTVPTPTPTPTPVPTPTPTPVPDPTPVITVPAAPSSLAISTLSRARAQLKWSDNATNETGYQVWRYASGSWSLYASLPAGATTYSTPRMSRGTYEFKVCTVNSAGSSAFAGPVSFTVR